MENKVKVGDYIKGMYTGKIYIVTDISLSRDYFKAERLDTSRVIYILWSELKRNWECANYVKTPLYRAMYGDPKKF